MTLSLVKRTAIALACASIIGTASATVAAAIFSSPRNSHSITVVAVTDSNQAGAVGSNPPAAANANAQSGHDTNGWG